HTPPPPAIYTLSLHDALPICTDIDEILVLRKARRIGSQVRSKFSTKSGRRAARDDYERFLRAHPFAIDVFERLLAHIRELLEDRDRKSTRLNSSHDQISYAVF